MRLIKKNFNYRKQNYFKQQYSRKKFIVNFLLFFIFFCILIYLIEILLRKITSIAKKKFQWLIDYQDEIPKFKIQKIKTFFKNSFHSELGWIRKKNTKGIERKLNGISKFKIDQNGSRFNPFNLNKRRQKIVTFGDSFTFCRQVNDNQTWQAYLSSQRKLMWITLELEIMAQIRRLF